MQDKLIVALDFPTDGAARALVQELGDTVSYYKVGLELFLNSRGSIIDYLKGQDKKIFLDLKFHDIPNTVAQAARWATALGVDMFNVHASGGSEMLKTTMEAIKETCSKDNLTMPAIIGVTILTSFDESGIAQVGFKEDIKTTALNLASLCQEAGLHGVVCSPHEVAAIKERCGQDFLTVCPGIRPAWAAVGDQKRITTPSDALKIGVDHMVVGRPITKADNVREAARKVLAEIEGGNEYGINTR